jgi:hypothetical protein
VTNNLYREFWKAQAGYMRDRSPNKLSNANPAKRSQFAAKSLFWNILPVSHCGSIFCRQATGFSSCNANEINILAQSEEKNVQPYPKLPGTRNCPLDLARLLQSVSEELHHEELPRVHEAAS